jgi:KDO2-lipid IV(A) lauroyltransferase
VTTLWREDTSLGRAIIKVLKGGGGLGMLVDQDTDIQGVFVPFFGRLAHSARAPADLALRFGSPILMGTCHRRGPHAGDGLQLEFSEIPYDPDAPDREAEVIRITAACQAVLEDAIRRFPADWVWMHDRWRTQPVPSVAQP